MNKKINKLLALSAACLAVSAFGGALVACGDGNNSTGGGTDNKPQQLSAPVISLTGNTVNWNAVDHATGYNVKVNSNAVVPVTQTSYTLTYTEAGEYKVTVVATSTDANYTDSVASNQVTYTVTAPEPEEKALVRLEATSPVAKTQYFLDEKATAVDLTGLALVARYDDDSTAPITVTAADIDGTVDLSSVGTKTVTIKYTENDVTRAYTFDVIVKERTAADLDAAGTAYTTAMNEFSSAAERYMIAETEVAGAVDLKGNTLTVTHDGGKSYIAASAFTSSGAMLIKTTGDDSAFINVVAAKYVRTAADMKAINEDLNGYYVLQNDISLDGTRINGNTITPYWAKGFTPIGQAPLKGTGETEAADDAVRLDFTSTDGLTQEGKAFTGTFDGNGHIIDDMLVFFPEEKPAKYTAYYLGMFGYIGKTGVVKNFTLRKANVRGGQSSSFIAGVNLGTIQNVVIDDTCKLLVNYADTRGCGYIADYNAGAIKNVVCYATEFTYRNGDIDETLIKSFIDKEDQAGTAENCYLGDATNLTATLGSDWFYIDGVGTYFGNADYGKVLSYEDTVFVGQTFNVKVYSKTPIDSGDIAFLADWTANEAADELEAPQLEVKSVGDNGIYAVGFADTVTSELFATVKKFRIGIRIGEKYIDNFIVTVGDPYITGIKNVVTENIECAQGRELALGTITLTIEKSDGTTITANPTAVRNLDTETVGDKQVIFVYSDGVNEFTINGTVKVIAVSNEITASVKSGVEKVIIPFVGGRWSIENITDWTQFFDISETDVTVSVSGALSGNIAFTFSKTGYAPATVTIDSYLGVDSATAFAAINQNLSAWYIVTDNIDFQGASNVPIGGIPLKQDESGTEFNSEIANIAGLPFTGIFDGNNKILSNYCLLEPFSVAWTQDHFGGMFGYVGEGGVVKNFTLSGAKLNSVNYTSFVTGYNQGTITGITVNANCTIYANYGAAGAFAYVNAGAISNCKCYVTKCSKTGDTQIDLTAVNLNYGSGLDADTVIVTAPPAETPSGSSL